MPVAQQTMMLISYTTKVPMLKYTSWRHCNRCHLLQRLVVVVQGHLVVIQVEEQLNRIITKVYCSNGVSLGLHQEVSRIEGCVFCDYVSLS